MYRARAVPGVERLERTRMFQEETMELASEAHAASTPKRQAPYRSESKRSHQPA